MKLVSFNPKLGDNLIKIKNCVTFTHAHIKNNLNRNTNDYN